MIEGHGDDLYRYQQDIRINFSSNIYQHANYDRLKEYLATRLDDIAHYPEPQALSLERLLAAQHRLPADCVMVTSGVTEAIYLIAQMTQGSTSIIPQPTFNEYADACRINQHTVTYDEDFSTSELPPQRVYWLCNPNNPTGNVMTEGIIDHLVAKDKGCLYVVDQSYEDYTAKPLIDVRQVNKYSNLILLHSLSKRYAVPGLRVGYVTAHPDLIARLRGFQRPWAVDALALAGARYLVEQHVPAVTPIGDLLRATSRLVEQLRGIEGIHVCDTDATFMLCMIEQATAAQLKHDLVEHHGILIRDCSNFACLTPHHFRIATQTDEENALLVAAIREFLHR